MSSRLGAADLDDLALDSLIREPFVVSIFNFLGAFALSLSCIKIFYLDAL